MFYGHAKRMLNKQCSISHIHFMIHKKNGFHTVERRKKKDAIICTSMLSSICSLISRFDNRKKRTEREFLLKESR